jgi:hypothetical protein
VIRYADNIASVGFESSRPILQLKGQTSGVSSVKRPLMPLAKHDIFIEDMVTMEYHSQNQLKKLP